MPIPQIMEELVRQRIVERSVPGPLVMEGMKVSCYWFKVIQFFVSCPFPGETLSHVSRMECNASSKRVGPRPNSVRWPMASSSSGQGPAQGRWRQPSVRPVALVGGRTVLVMGHQGPEVDALLSGLSKAKEACTRTAIEGTVGSHRRSHGTVTIADSEIESRTRSRDGASQFSVAETGTVARDCQNQFSLRNQHRPILTTNWRC